MTEEQCKKLVDFLGKMARLETVKQ